jgi:hypothetical protein
MMIILIIGYWLGNITMVEESDEQYEKEYKGKISVAELKKRRYENP